MTEQTAFNKDLLSRIKLLRKELDRTLQQMAGIKSRLNQDGAREFSLAITKLEEARMWSGATLGALGSELPPEYADKFQKGEEN